MEGYLLTLALTTASPSPTDSLALEESFGWSGVCVEPYPGAFAMLTLNHPCCIRINAGIDDAVGTFDFLTVTGYFEMRSGCLTGATPEHPLARFETEIAAHGGTKAVIIYKALGFGALLGYRPAVVDFDFVSMTLTFRCSAALTFPVFSVFEINSD